MSLESSPQPATASREYFNETFDKAHVIQDQNDRYDQVNGEELFDGQYEDFREIAVLGLQQEQFATIEDLASEDYFAYEMIANAQSAVERQIDEATCRLETITDEEDERKTRLMAVAKRAIELSPLAKDDADELYRKHLKKLDALNKQGLQHRLGELRADAVVIEELYQNAARPWPVPMVIDGFSTASDQEPDVVETEFVVEEMPGEPHIVDRESVTKRLVERYGHTTNASIMAAAFLIENQGRILTPAEVGADVYSDSDELDSLSTEKADHVKYCRILTLLNPNQGRVAEMLYKEGYELQYGDRIVFNSLGKQKGPVRRLYRAVPITPDYIPGTSFTEEQRADSTTDVIEKLEPALLEGSEDEKVEMSASDEVIQTIEASVSLTKSEANRITMEDVIEEAEVLAPIVFGAGLMPSERNGKISQRRLIAQSMRPDVAKALRQSPSLLRIEERSKSYNQLDYKLSPVEVLCLFAPSIDSPGVSLNSHNKKIAAEKIESIIDGLYSPDEEQ